MPVTENQPIPVAPVAELAPVVELIERTWNRFSRFFSNLFPWMVLSCIGSIAFGAVHSENLSSGSFNTWGLIAALVGGIVTLVSYLALVRIVAEKEADPKDILGNGRASLSLFFPYIWLMILQGFMLIGGFTIFVIPGLIFSVYMTVVVFVFVVEGKRSVDVLTRSWGYITGRWWQTLWRMAVVFFLLVLITLLLGIILSLAFGGSANWGVSVIQNILESFFIGPLLLCYLFELYADLRVTKPLPDALAEKTAKLWLVIFLFIGIMLALLGAFGAVTQTAAHGYREFPSARHLK